MIPLIVILMVKWSWNTIKKIIKKHFFYTLYQHVTGIIKPLKQKKRMAIKTAH